MSFPHRTAMYQKEKGKIVYPDDYQEYVMKRNGNPTYPGHYPDGTPDLQKSQYLIPLASTGLKDSESNEIFEGHLLKREYEANVNSIFCIYWDDGSFCWVPSNFNSSRIRNENTVTTEIVGHALTDPELVPDSFDTEEYFDL